MQKNPEGIESDPAVGPQTMREEFSFRLSCRGKRIREGCDRGSEVRTIHRG